MGKLQHRAQGCWDLSKCSTQQSWQSRGSREHSQSAGRAEPQGAMSFTPETSGSSISHQSQALH